MKKPKTANDRYRAAWADYSRAYAGFDQTIRCLRKRLPFSPKCNVGAPRYCLDDEQVQALGSSGQRDLDYVFADKHLRVCKAHWALHNLWLEMTAQYREYIAGLDEFERQAAQNHWKFDEDRIDALVPTNEPR